MTDCDTPSIDHVYERCTRDDTCRGCTSGGLDCKFEALSICKVCGGMEGSLLPECPGRWLTYEEDQANYQHYCDHTGPFAKPDEDDCREAQDDTSSNGPFK